MWLCLPTIAFAPPHPRPAGPTSTCLSRGSTRRRYCRPTRFPGTPAPTSAALSTSPGQRALVPTGLAIALPYGYAAFIHPRSGLAARTGLSIVNAPGTVDAGYRGEVGVLLVNTDTQGDVVLHLGDRIAQLVVQRGERAAFVEVGELPRSARSVAGFGSTGGFTHTDFTHTGSIDTGSIDTGSTDAEPTHEKGRG